MSKQNHFCYLQATEWNNLSSSYYSAIKRLLIKKVSIVILVIISSESGNIHYNVKINVGNVQVQFNSGLITSNEYEVCFA